ncbi:translin [Rhodnius prolixus]|uniref:Translin n=2 Tax=Rhodnius TaxID=13248 RepID=A0A905QWJ7_RHOPR
MTTENKIVDLFAGFQKNLNEEQNLREKIRDVIKEIEEVSRELATVLQGIHLEKSATEVPQILVKSKTLLSDASKRFVELSTIIPNGEYYKYHDHWRWVAQKLVFDIALIQFLQDGELATKEFVASQLNLKTDRLEGFHLDLEDYLHGLLQLASELSRLAVTSATSGDYSKPLQISQFVTELNAGFRLINFKNDSLRKHYDGLKYDLKKIEEVVYDISIRGLKPSTNNDCDNV